MESAGSRVGELRSITVPRRIALGIAALYAMFGTLWIVASDRLLPDLGADLEEMLHLSTLKGVLFVLVTSLLLYVLLRVMPREPEEGDKPHARGGLLAAIFVALAGAILLIGYQVQQQNLREIEDRNYSALRSTAFIKAQRVGEWFGDQVGTTTALGVMYAESTAELPALLAAPEAHAGLLAHLANTAELLGIDSVALADAQGTVLLAEGVAVEPGLVTAAIGRAAGREVGFSGTLPAATGGMQAAFAYRLPVESAPARWLIVALNPGPRLASILHRWPLAGTSGETSLASLGPDGELVFLPGFEAPVHGGRLLSYPTRAPQPESGFARRGAAGIIDGYLPDGRAVLLTMSRVPGVDWIVVGAIDRSEVYAGAANLLRNTVVVVLLALLIAGWLILSLFRQQQLLNRALLDRMTRERDLLDQHFAYLTRFANDIVLLLDADGQIINCNDRAFSAYGYTREELIGRNTLELRPPALAEAGRRQLSRAKSAGGMVFETWHRRKDGTEFPVEVSVRSFEVDGETFLQSILRDISERKEAEEELRLSEQRFRNIFDHTAVGMAHVSTDGQFLMVNRRFAQLVGFSPRELERMNVWQISLPEDLKREMALGKQILDGEREDYMMEKRYRRKDGNVFWAQLTVSAIRDDKGAVEYLVGAIEDIGERKQLELQLKRRTMLYRTLSETNRLIARAQSVDDLLMEACGIAVSYVALPLAAVTRFGTGEPAVIASAGPEAQSLAEELLQQELQSGVFPIAAGDSAHPGVMIVNNVESGLVTAGARLACLRRGVRSYASFPLGDPAVPEARLAVFSREWDFFRGDTLDLLADMARDVSLAMDRSREREARERAESRLREVAHRMSALVDAAPVPVISLDAEGRVLDVWNPAAERLFGWRREDALGRRLPFVPDQPEDQAQFDELRRRILAGESFAGVEVLQRRRDGSPVYLSLSASVITAAEGERGILVVAEDITEWHEAMAAVSQARDELEQRVARRTAELAAERDRAAEADRIKTAFLANMSHELRTPLNSIIGFSSLLLSGAPGPVNEEQGKQLVIVRRAGERLLALIEDILDISRLQAVDARLPLEPTSLREMVLRVVDTLQSQAIGRGLTIATDIGPCRAMAEPRRLEQVLTNLVGNAVKFTDKGGVTVRCRRVNDCVEIAIEDTGRGISAEDQQRLFKAFGQQQRAAPEHGEGAGLGLAISRHLVEAMGGTISVASERGRGSVFTVQLDAELESNRETPGA